MNNDLKPAVVIDNGQEKCGIGFEEEDAPKFCIPTVVGKPKNCNSTENQKIFIGEEAKAQRKTLSLTYPIENGIVINWDDMERIWHHAFFNLLKISPEEQGAFFTQAPMTSKFNQERITQIIFENFNFPLFSVFSAPVLSLIASGRLTGIAVESGEGITHFVPIYDGYQLPQNLSKTDFAGKTCTDYLALLFNQQGQSFYSSDQREIVKDIKEKLCYVALDPKEEELKYKESNAMGKPYKLPDGNIMVEDQRFRCPEILFTPENFNLDKAGIHRMTFNSIIKCDIDMRRDLYSNIVLSGGTTLFPGLPERFSKEMTNLTPQTIKIKVVAPPERKFSAWIGGSILSSLSTFKSQWITRSEYDETGPTIVHRRCF